MATLQVCLKGTRNRLLQVYDLENSDFGNIHAVFINNARLKLAKDQAKAKQLPEAELSLFENYSLSSSKNNKKYSKKCAKNKCHCFNDVI